MALNGSCSYPVPRTQLRRSEQILNTKASSELTIFVCLSPQIVKEYIQLMIKATAT